MTVECQHGRWTARGDEALLRRCLEALEAMQNWDWDSWDFTVNNDWTVQQQERLDDDMALLRIVIVDLNERLLAE